MGSPLYRIFRWGPHSRRGGCDKCRNRALESATPYSLRQCKMTMVTTERAERLPLWLLDCYLLAYFDRSRRPNNFHICLVHAPFLFQYFCGGKQCCITLFALICHRTHDRQILVPASHAKLPGCHFSQHEFANIRVSHLDKSDCRHGSVLPFFHQIAAMPHTECRTQFGEMPCHEITHCFDTFFQRSVFGKFLHCQLCKRTVRTLFYFREFLN